MSKRIIDRIRRAWEDWLGSYYEIMAAITVMITYAYCLIKIFKSGNWYTGLALLLLHWISQEVSEVNSRQVERRLELRIKEFENDFDDYKWAAERMFIKKGDK